MSTQTIADIQEEIREEFEMFPDWQDRYQHIISIGKAMPPFPVEEQREENKVRGCQSNVWLISRIEGDSIIFEGDSDALIVKGLVGLVLRLLSGHTPDEILEADIMEFLSSIGLQQHLSPTRSNGLAAMVKQIKFYAVAYKAKMGS